MRIGSTARVTAVVLALGAGWALAPSAFARTDRALHSTSLRSLPTNITRGDTHGEDAGDEHGTRTPTTRPATRPPTNPPDWLATGSRRPAVRTIRFGVSPTTKRATYPPTDGGVTTEAFGTPGPAGTVDATSQGVDAAVTEAVTDAAAAAPTAVPAAAAPSTPAPAVAPTAPGDEFALPFSTPTDGEAPGLIDGTIVALYSILGLGTAVLAGRALRGRDRRLATARDDAERVAFE